MVKTGFERRIWHTIQDPSEFEKELEKVRIEGFAADIINDERNRRPGGRPMYNAAKEIIACASFRVPPLRLSDKKKRYEYGQIVREFAGQMSKDYS